MGEVERLKEEARRKRKEFEKLEDEIIEEKLAVGDLDEAVDMVKKARKRQWVEAFLEARRAEREAQSS